MTGNATGAPVEANTPWERAVTAAALLAVDPRGLGGVRIHAHAGPVREEWLACFKDLLPDGETVRRLPIHIAEDRLLGGLDLAATLGSGRPVAERGLLAESDGGVLVAAMAERLAGATVALLSAALDTGEVALERDGMSGRHSARLALIALDEAVGEEEGLAEPLADRLAFALDLCGLSHRDVFAGEVDPEAVADARARLAGIAVDDTHLEALCAAALALGVASLRAPLLALRAARAHAALAGRDRLADVDLRAAGQFVLAPRATRLPVDESEQEPEQETPPQDGEPADGEPGEDRGEQPLEDRVLEAAAAALPPDLLDALARGGNRRAAGATGRRGESGRSRRRGRPAGVVRGDPRRGDRLNVIETLRAAAPWQRLRRRGDKRGDDKRGDGKRVAVRVDDFRTTRLKQPVESVTIFAVDASGSSALHRLAEAKGAVELLLADCYVRRDQVALIAFRGAGAELLLPPTRALVRAKRSLAGLPGGGGTPLAAGIDMAAALADSVRRRGQTPGVVLLTDGRANIARDGQPGRPAAGEDALRSARAFAGLGSAAVLIDTSPRPQPLAEALAAAMAARYLVLPQADSATLSRAVRASGLAGGPVPRRAAS